MKKIVSKTIEKCGCNWECDCHSFVGGSGKPCPKCVEITSKIGDSK